ncbi:unnamed protein product [Bursaphelenchus xylophilus]|nr:unnamed protein product [Bursaphelenchus xylophilus]CAG9106568.1 unnamed protein product [Bursaphelenchus xylophilus]
MSENGTLVEDPTHSLRITLSIIGVVFGAETLAVNVFALWFFNKTSSFRNKHTMLIMIKILADIPAVSVLIFWWLPWVFFMDKMTVEVLPWFRYPNVVFSSIAHFTSFFALNMQIHILMARFVGVFYTFTFNKIFRRKYMIILFGINIFWCFNSVALTSFYFGAFNFYIPGLFFSFSLKVPSFAQVDIPMAAQIAVMVQIWILVAICLGLAIATVVKLRRLNNAQAEAHGMGGEIGKKRRSAEWKLLVISIASPLLCTIQLVALASSYFYLKGENLSELIIYCFFVTCVAELLQAQSYA